MAQIQDLQRKVNSLSDAREFNASETGSSSGATNVPDETSTILSSRTSPRCDSGLPRNTRNCTGVMGNVFERPLVQFKEFGIFISGFETYRRDAGYWRT